jgi:hypothetical protein
MTTAEACIYVRSGLNVSQIDLGHDFWEMIWLEVGRANRRGLTIGCINCSPNSTELNAKNVNKIQQETSADKHKNNLLVCDDFNYPKLDWATNNLRCGSNHPATKFYNSCTDAILEQLVTFPTRIREHQNKNTLDLVLTKTFIFWCIKSSRLHKKIINLQNNYILWNMLFSHEKKQFGTL